MFTFPQPSIVLRPLALKYIELICANIQIYYGAENLQLSELTTPTIGLQVNLTDKHKGTLSYLQMQKLASRLMQSEACHSSANTEHNGQSQAWNSMPNTKFGIKHSQACNSVSTLHFNPKREIQCHT